MENNERKSILGIDDCATQLKIFEKLLNAEYDLSLVKSASEALKLLNLKVFNLILLDIEMPDISGFEFLHEIRKIPQYMSIPVIIVTIHSETELLAHAKKSSASGILVKPVKSEQLFNAIESAFSGPAINPFKL